MISKIYRRILEARQAALLIVSSLPITVKADPNLQKWEMKMYGHAIVPTPKKTILFMTVSEVTFV